MKNNLSILHMNTKKSIHYHFNGKQNSKKVISLLVTYHPFLKLLSKIMRKNLYLFHMDEEVKKVFTHVSIISLRNLRKLRSYLVTAKLYPTERVFGSFK